MVSNISDVDKVFIYLVVSSFIL